MTKARHHLVCSTYLCVRFKRWWVLVYKLQLSNGNWFITKCVNWILTKHEYPQIMMRQPRWDTLYSRLFMWFCIYFLRVKFWYLIQFIYSEKAKKCCEIFTLLLSYVVPVKSKGKISQYFVAFPEYMNFTRNQALQAWF